MTRPALPSPHPTGTLLLATAVAPALMGLLLARPASAKRMPEPPPPPPGASAPTASDRPVPVVGASASAPGQPVPAPPAASGPAPASSGPAPAGSGPAPASSAGDAPITEAEMAAAQNTNDNPYIPVVSTRRSGFLFGMAGGLALSSASGTPAKFSQRGNPVDTGFTPGVGGSFYIGGVFTDWFSFHVGGVTSGATSGNLKTAGGGVIFGIEAWPLFSLGGIYRDLGVQIDFGTGSSSVVDKNDTKTIKADGGGASLIRGGVFLDPNLFWRINLGPMIALEHRWTDIYTENIVWVGGRLAFYGGP